MNFTRASNSVVRAVRRRLEKATPPRRLVEDSIKCLPLPGTDHQATLFIFETGVKRVFVAELSVPDLPHIYRAIPLPEPRSIWRGGAKADAKELTRIMLTAIRDLAATLASDPRFKRNIIVLNGSAVH